MKKTLSLLFCLVPILCCLPACAAVLRVYTPFADMDPGAQGWEELLRAWEEKTGHTAEDYSGVPDEDWLNSLRDALSRGEADLVVLPVGSGFGTSELLSAGELSELGLAGARALPALAERDGTVLLTPLRFQFETLFVNRDVLEKHALPVPASWEDLAVSCAVLAQSGVTPVACALTEWPEIALDCAAMMAAPAGVYGSETSLNGAALVLAQLSALGAFGSDPWNAADEACANAFLSGKAAMRFDSWDLSLSVPEERQDLVEAVPLPGLDGEARRTLVGAPGCGLALSRACAQDPERREAALSLAAAMLSPEGEAAVVTAAGGRLAESMAELTLSADGTAGVLYDLNPDGFDDWAEKTVSSLMSEE